MTPQTARVFLMIASNRFWEARERDVRAISELLELDFIKPARQGKLRGYVLAPAGYRHWLGHQQR